MSSVIIIGGGVSGVTTALTLQFLGYDTTIYTDKTAINTNDKHSHPEFASLFPSASIIPHSVYSNRLEELFKDSQSIFYELRKLIFPGVTIHKHYEVFEFEKEEPNYLSWMPNVQYLNDGNSDLNPPKRPDINKLYGWVFDCIFADWPLYLPALYELYQKAGGEIQIQKLTTKDIHDLPSSTVINCSGLGSRFLFDDPAPQLLLRGHLLSKKEAPLITNKNDEIVSYNYTPKSSVYADSEGDACDVYCYPRKDDWIIGGSRQAGTVDEEGNWQGNQEGNSYEMNNIPFPRQILDLNKEIIEHSFDTPFGEFDDYRPFVGYRYIRNKIDGLRLEQEEMGNKKIYHNYGHGGAGVTLSWGCALHIASKITSKENRELQSLILEKIQEIDLE